MEEVTGVRGKNALCSASAAMAALLMMSLWIGGAVQFLPIVLGFFPLFLLVAFFALLLGASLPPTGPRWALLLGAVSGLAGAVAIVLRVMSQI